MVITGHTKGLGKCIYEEFLSAEYYEKFTPIGFDINEGYDIRNSEHAKAFFGSIEHDVFALINCAGINRIDYLEDMSEEDWDLVMDTNAKGIFNMCKAALPKLIETKGTIINIVSNASHMPMTSSLAYNASKGAAHIMTLQLARELTKRHGITVFGISPNKLAGTGMSDYLDSRVPEQRGWTEEQAKEYQLNNILAGEETDPQILAEFIHYLLSKKSRHKFLTGTVIPYGV